jgi:hypothetical protein
MRSRRATGGHACYLCAAVRRAIALIAILLGAAGCNWNSAFERLQEARRLTAALLVQFLKTSDAGNRAVMADTDELSSAFAREATEATEAAQKDADLLALLLQGLGLVKEASLLDEFRTRFAEYRALDRRILELAVENTNLKAQRLSFTSAQQAADACRDALDAIGRWEASRPAIWQIKALAAMAMASVREVQVLEAPHIAEPDDVVMTRLEKRMSSAEATARKSIEALAGLIQPASRPQLAAAATALSRFSEVNAQIIQLSRRNTNVRSLALSLNQKRKIAAACEANLRALQDALAQHGFRGTR